MEPEQFVYARLNITSARYRYDRICEQLEEFEEDTTGVRRSMQYLVFQDIALVDCQICIEVATKIMLTLLGLNYPQSHAISFDDAATTSVTRHRRC